MFPKYKTRECSFLFLKWEEKIADGWEDLGETPGWSEFVNGERVNVHSCCSLCGRRMRVGRENDKTFLFCPLCLKKEGLEYVEKAKKEWEKKYGTKHRSAKELETFLTSK